MLGTEREQHESLAAVFARSVKIDCPGSHRRRTGAARGGCFCRRELAALDVGAPRKPSNAREGAATRLSRLEQRIFGLTDSDFTRRLRERIDADDTRRSVPAVKATSTVYLFGQVASL